MDKFLIRRLNSQLTRKDGLNCELPDHCVDLIDPEGDSSYKEELQKTSDKDIRSFFFASSSDMKCDKLDRSLKYSNISNTKRSNGDANYVLENVKVSPGKSVSNKVFPMFEKNTLQTTNNTTDSSNGHVRKRHLSETNSDNDDDEPSAMFKVKFSWSKKQKLQDAESQIKETKIREDIHFDLRKFEESKEAASPVLLIDRSQATQKMLKDHSSSDDDFEQPRAATFKKQLRTRVDQTLLYEDRVESVKGERDENVKELRRSSRICSRPSRFEFMVEEDLSCSPKKKKETTTKNIKKVAKNKSKSLKDSDDDDVLIVGVANSDNLTMKHGKVVEVAPLFKKITRMSAEELERRKCFLMSGVPEEIKRQQVILHVQAASASAYAPFPHFNHITQNVSNSHDDKEDTSLFPVPTTNLTNCRVSPSTSFPQKHFCHLWQQGENKNHLKNCVKVSSMFYESNVLDHLLLEIKAARLEFPVESVFQKLKAKHKREPRKLSPKTSSAEIESWDVNSDVEYDDEEETLEYEVKNLLWTDKYLPSRASEMIGNEVACKRAFDWLNELKSKYSHSSEDKGSDSMDDFWTPKNDSNSSQGLSSTNVLIIMGPHGVGKTSLVYAIAEELGFKVFEVNPSSSREGRQVWSQLQEATQSHQLQTSRQWSPANVEVRPAKNEAAKQRASKSKSPRRKVLTSIYATKLPLKASKVQDKQKHLITMETIKKKKLSTKKNKFQMKRQTEARNGYSTAAKNSLILFDEADVVFESDKGFWTAVQKFVKTTKRPIVLTVSDEHFVEKFNMNIEVLIMEKPERDILTSYLQTMCLVEGLRVLRNDVKSLVQSFGHDLRKCSLQLQMIFSHKIIPISLVEPIRYSKSCLEPPVNTESHKNFTPGMSHLPSQPKSDLTSMQPQNGEGLRAKGGNSKSSFSQTSMTAYLSSLKDPCNDDDDFIVLPASKRIDSCSDDDNGTKKEEVDEEKTMEEEYMEVQCEVPMLQIPGSFVHPLPQIVMHSSCKDCTEFQKNVLAEVTIENNGTVPDFLEHPFYEHFLCSLLKLEQSKYLHESKIAPSDDLKSLKHLSRMYNWLSLSSITNMNRPAECDLNFRNMLKPLPGDLDQFGDDDDYTRWMQNQISMEIRNSALNLLQNRFADVSRSNQTLQNVLSKGECCLGKLKNQARTFKDRQTLMFDLRKSSTKNMLQWNVFPEVLPMLVKISEAENFRKNKHSKRRFLHHLSNIFPNVHPERFNFKM